MYKTGIPWHVPAYIKSSSSSDEPEELAYNLIVFQDHTQSHLTKSIYTVPNEDYIPVFEDINECHALVTSLIQEHKDSSFITCIFQNLYHLEQRIKEEFKDKNIRLVIKEKDT